MKRGFTLIELLVVTSTISLLSTMTLASLSSARIKAFNSSLNSEIHQYQNAFELYAVSNNGRYPAPDNTSNSTVFTCLGSYNDSGAYAGGKCGKSTLPISPSPNLGNVFLAAGYLKSFPPVSARKIIFSDGATWLGAEYLCDVTITGNSPATGCKAAHIIWYLQGANQNCGPGVVSLAGVDPITQAAVSDDPNTTLCLLSMGYPNQ